MMKTGPLENDRIKKSLSLANGWTVHLIADPPYDDLIRVISPWGDHTNLVKNEESGCQNLLWRYFATVIYTAGQANMPTVFDGPGTILIPGIGQVTLTSPLVPPFSKDHQ